MDIIFIDTNIYLGFYNSNKPEFKKLLKSLLELKENIFTTTHLLDELNRNKLNIFQQSIDNYLKHSGLSSLLLPEHLDSEDNSRLKDWNKNRKELNKQLEESNKDLSKILGEIMKKISISDDSVSKELAVLFEGTPSPTEEQLSKARYRKELGNPPGKTQDPLGDQLTWEMLLPLIEKVTSIWIVTNDRDYCSEHQGVLNLNPILYQELIKRNPNIEIKLFDKLSEALIDYNNKVKIKTFPSENELEKIALDEQKERETVIHFQDFTDLKPSICPECSEKDRFTSGSYLRSRYGGLTLQYVCMNCGFHYDTGDSWD